MKPVNLNRREKNYVIGGVVFLVVLLFFQLIIFPLLHKRDRLIRSLADKTEELQQMQSLQSEYLVLEKNAQLVKSELTRRDKNFSLFSFLDQLAGEVGIKENVSSMKPSSSTVSDVKIAILKLKIEAITMEQLANYLYRVEYSGNNLYVRRMAISETSKPAGYIDVTLQVETIES